MKLPKINAPASKSNREKIVIMIENNKTAILNPREILFTMNRLDNFII